MNKVQSLALLEVDKIHSYIFATNNLKEIRGASYLLSKINEEETEQVLKSCLTAKTKILSTGGVTKVIFDDENEAHLFLKQMERIYREDLITASVTTHVEPITPEYLFSWDDVPGNDSKRLLRFLRDDWGIDWAENAGIHKSADGKTIRIFKDENFAEITIDVGKEKAIFKINGGTRYLTVKKENGKLNIYNPNFHSAIEKGELAIRAKKEDKDCTFQVNTTGFYKICTRCGQYPAKETESTQDGILWLCASCKQKRTNTHRLSIHDSITNKIKASHPEVGEVDFPEQFEDIGKEAQVEGYMGYVVADGNRMGEKIKSPEVSSNADVYHDFSKKVKECTDEALVEAIIESVPKTFERDNSVFLPVLVLILGGDDMTLVTTAESALPLANKFSQKFQQKTVEKGVPKISMSVGVVISKITFPIFSYAKLGEELLKSAKRLSREMMKVGKEVGAIDFMVVTSPSTKSLEEVRRDTFYYEKKDTGERFWLTARPYTTKESDYDFNLDKLLNCTRRFKNSDFPRNKLKAMDRYLRLGRENSIHEFGTMRLRLEEPKKTHYGLLNDFIRTFKLHEKMPWRIENDKRGEYSLTNLLDLVEIYDFVSGGKQ